MDVNTVIGISASIIALSALFVSIWQSVQIIKHNRLSTKPLLNFVNELEYDASIASLKIINNGLGPAIMKESEIYLDDIFIGPANEKSWETILKKIDLSLPSLYLMRFASGFPIKPTDSINLVWIDPNSAEKDDRALLTASMKRIKLNIKYESIYGEKFSVQWKGSNASA